MQANAYLQCDAHRIGHSFVTGDQVVVNRLAVVARQVRAA